MTEMYDRAIEICAKLGVMVSLDHQTNPNELFFDGFSFSIERSVATEENCSPAALDLMKRTNRKHLYILFGPVGGPKSFETFEGAFCRYIEDLVGRRINEYLESLAREYEI